MKILITDIAWPDIDIEREVLAEIGAEPILAESSDESGLVAAAAGCCAIMTCWAKTTRAVIDACVDCRIVARLGIGLDNIDVAYCTERGIPVTNVPDYCIGEVADHAFALLLACARKVALFDCAIKAGNYSLQAGSPLHRIAGQTLGIIGFGKIGREVAKRAAAFGMRVLALSRSLTDDEAKSAGAERSDLEAIFRDSDFISLHAPLTAETEHLLGPDQFTKMKPTAFVINTARGGIIDHDALLEALNAGQIQGAALDVTDPEPLPDDHPLILHEKVIHTPHAAFSSEESVAELRQRTAQEVVRILKGEAPENQVNVT